MSERLAGFKGEYLWELDIAEHHLNALADAIPVDKYCWRPAEPARSVSQILVHIASGNFLLLNLVGKSLPSDLYGKIDEDLPQRFWAVVSKNVALENQVTEKARVQNLLQRSLIAVRSSFTEENNLDRSGNFFGETTTVRRVYMRMLTHSHEHMGQLIAYARTMGVAPPWPDPKASN